MLLTSPVPIKFAFNLFDELILACFVSNAVLIVVKFASIASKLVTSPDCKVVNVAICPVILVNCACKFEPISINLRLEPDRSTLFIANL